MGSMNFYLHKHENFYVNWSISGGQTWYVDFLYFLTESHPALFSIFIQKINET